jgi:hypothetical protein
VLLFFVVDCGCRLQRGGVADKEALRPVAVRSARPRAPDPPVLPPCAAVRRRAGLDRGAALGERGVIIAGVPDES